MRAMRTRIGIWAAGLAGLVLMGSCQKQQSMPAPPEFTAAQRAVWQLAPEDAMGGMVIADFGHLLGRVRALRTVLETGPVTRQYLQKGFAFATEKLGFDPLDPEGWRKAGLEPDGPFAVFIKSEKAAQIVFRASDAARATATATAWVALGGANDPFDCAPAGAYLRCGTPTWKLAPDAAHSLWPHLEANLLPAHRGMEVLVYAPLDRGEAKEALAKPDSPLKGMHAGYFGLTLASERVIVRMGARLDEAAKALPYLKPRDGESLLGLAAGGVQAARITFSPDKLWQLATETLGGKGFGDKEAAMVQAATGLDLQKDLIDNLSGEIVSAGYRSDRKLGKDGKPRGYTDRLSAVVVVGMRDEPRSRHVAVRLGELLGGAATAYGEISAAAGAKITFTIEPGATESGNRPVHRFRFDFSGELLKTLKLPSFEGFITSTPGGLVFGYGEDGVEELRRHAAGKAEDFLAGLPLPEERALFERSPFVVWGRTGDGFAARMQLGAATAVLDVIYPDASKVLLEVSELAQLIFDAVAGVEVSADRAELMYQVTFL